VHKVHVHVPLLGGTSHSSPPKTEPLLEAARLDYRRLKTFTENASYAMSSSVGGCRAASRKFSHHTTRDF
jgi:hypothetical protein